MIAIMKKTVLLLTVLSTIFVSNLFAHQSTDTSLAKKVQILETKVTAQQKEIDQLKTKKTTEPVYIIDRRGSKQLIKKTDN